MNRAAAGALPLLLALACRQLSTTPAPAERPAEPAPPPTAPPDARTPPAPQMPTFQVEGRRVRLVEEGNRCALAYAAADHPEQVAKLSLTPPCHLMIWNGPPPRRDGDRPSKRASGAGVPIGRAGDPMAWRYRSAGDATVVAIIGDPVPERMRDETYRRWADRGFRCAGSIQGVALRKDDVSTTSARSQVGLFCVEVGVDQKEFWLLAHPAPLH